MVRLEEQVVSYRHSLYEEAVFICSKRKLESPVDYYERILSRCSSKEDEHSDSEISPLSVARTVSTSSDIVSDDRSSLSLVRTTSTSSDIVSDQTAQNSSDLVNGKSNSSTADSLENRTPCDSKRNTNIKARHTRRNSSDLMNGKQGLFDHDFSLELVKKEKEEEDDRKCSISFRNVQSSERKLSRVKTPVKKSSFKRQPSQKQVYNFYIRQSFTKDHLNVI